MKDLAFPMLFMISCASFADNVGDSNLTEIEALLADYVTSVNELDLTKAEQIWSQTSTTSFIHPRGHEKGWQDIKASFYLDTMGRFSQRDLRLHDIDVHLLSSDIAWGEFYWDFDATFKDGTPLKTTGRETQIWRKESGGWKILHVHYSGQPVAGEREGF